jgi:hypothetical protein
MPICHQKGYWCDASCGNGRCVGSHLVKALRTAGVHASQIKVLDNLWRGGLANLQYNDGLWAINVIEDFCNMHHYVVVLQKAGVRRKFKSQ